MLSRTYFLVRLLVAFMALANLAAACTAPANHTVAICSPANGSTVASPVQFSAAARDDDHRLTAMALYVDSQKLATSSSATLTASLSLATGKHAVTVRAWNAAGQSFSASSTVTVGTSSSASVTIQSPANGATVASPVSISAVANDSNTVTGMAVYLDGTKVAASSSNTISASVPASNGTHNLTVRAWNSAGAVYDARRSFMVGTSSGTPYIAINSPANGSTVKSPISFSAIANDSRAVTGMAIYIDGTKRATSSSGTINSSLWLSDGTHAITFRAWNSAGAVYDAKETITVVESSPMVSIVATPDHINPGQSTTLAVSTRFATNVGVTNSLDGSRVALSNSGGSFSVSPGQTAKYTVSATGSDGKAISNSTFVVVSEPQKIGVINHIVIAMQENRSFDNYFGRLGAYRRSKGLAADITELPLDVRLEDKGGHWIRPFKLPTVCHESVTPAWGASHVAYNDGKMDKYLRVADASTIDPHGTRPMGYYDWNDLPYYYEAATQFATSDYFFSSVLSRTPPNRMYFMGGSSYGNIAGGDVPDTAPTIFDRLTAKGISWKYYVVTGAYVQLQTWNTYNTDRDKVRPISEYFTDIANGTLPQVAFIERTGALDEHPSDNIQKGAADIKKEVDALMKSGYWKNSVFFLTFDEGGGMYDHVPPIKVPAPDDIPPKLSPTDKPGDFTLSGFRVPLIVFSPYIRPNYVSHVPRDLTSILAFIETRFNLQPLTRRDAWADDMTEMFNFNTPHWLTPPPLPAQPQTGVCDYNLEVAPDEP